MPALLATSPEVRAATLTVEGAPPASASRFRICAARPRDVPGIARLVEVWHAAGENLPRSAEEIAHAIEEFVVATTAAGIAGCGALVRYRRDLAEIRSVGVDPGVHGGGVGSRLVRRLIVKAAEEGIETVFVLTRAPGFFARFGFVPVGMDALPEKVFRDCRRCHRRSSCDEVAMVRPTP